MPSGYTADLHDGKSVSLPDFIMGCARGMGALVMMRDDPPGSPIVDFEPEDYYARKAEEAQRRLDELANLRAEEIERQADEAHQAAYDAWRTRRDKKLSVRGRYEDMLNKVKAWQPPTPEHQGLLDFMVEQLESSIKFDCSFAHDDPPVRQATGAWFTQAVEKAQKDFLYYVEQDAEEKSRTAARNAWVQALRKSLPLAGPSS